MKFRARKTLRFGPIVIHLTQRGVSSWGIRVGRDADEMVVLCAACAPVLRGPVSDAVRDVVGRHTTTGRGGSS